MLTIRAVFSTLEVVVMPVPQSGSYYYKFSTWRVFNPLNCLRETPLGGLSTA